MFKSLKALVLREVKYKESDKILTVLTETEGKLIVKAPGAVKSNCKFGAAAQVFCFSEMVIYERMGMWLLKEAETIEQFLPLREDFSRLALAAYFAELLEVCSDEDSPEPELLQLGLNCLYALSRSLFSQEHVKASFELKLACLSGFEPRLDACPVCGNDKAEELMFSVFGGTVHCPACPPGEPGKSFRMEPETLLAMRYIASSPQKRLLSFEIPDSAQKLLSDITEAYLIAQLDRPFSSLDFYKATRGMSPS